MVAANGLEFEVFEAGAGERLALLLHGFPQHAICWRHQVPLLVEKGYRVWAVNQRGYGATTRPLETEAYRLNALSDDAAALVDASGASKFTLIGHDWGGFVALSLASRKLRPLERLVLLNTPHPQSFRRALKGWRQSLRSAYSLFFQWRGPPDWFLSAGHAAFPGFVFAYNLHKGAITGDALALYRDEISKPGAISAMLNWYRAAGGDLVDSNAHRTVIDTPTLMIWGAADLALGVECLEGTQKYLPMAQIERLPGVSHWTPEDAPQRVNALLNGFL